MLTAAAALAFVPAWAGRGATAAPRTHEIAMQNMRFGPVPSGIKAGDTIIWVNRDMVPHTATADDRSFDVVVPSRRSARMVVRRAGTTGFHCRYHPGMRGSLTAAV
jgi:plastocyanin